MKNDILYGVLCNNSIGDKEILMDKKNLNSRQQQAIHTKNKLYNIALELIDAKGYDNIKIDDICKKAEVSVGSFYNYFKSKNDILIEIYKRGDDYFRNEVANKIDNPNAADQILDYFRYYAKYNVTSGIDTTKQLYTSHNKLFIAKKRYMQVLLQDIIQKGQARNQLVKDLTPEEITEYLFIAARGVVYNWCLHDGEYDLEEAMLNYMKRIIETFVNQTNEES
ncbi:MAG: TetR family transcriptional regulator [Firmicutes bacterium]|nr:TetR family transcriptional regulator [Bacillota bacterium]